MARRPHDHEGRHESEPHRGHGEHHRAEDPAPEPRSLVKPSAVGGPVFAQPEPTPDPTRFAVRHASDREAYREIDALNREHRLAPMPFPPPRGGVEPRLTLAEMLGGEEDAQEIIAAIAAAGRLVFHTVGDTGSTRGPETQNRVADKMTSDFDDADRTDAPRFFLHLGDVVYSFGEAAYYYDQFYEPYRDYPAPIIAIAGNHDGMVAPNRGRRRSPPSSRISASSTSSSRPRPAGSRAPRRSRPVSSSPSRRPFSACSRSIPTRSRIRA